MDDEFACAIDRGLDDLAEALGEGGVPDLAEALGRLDALAGESAMRAGFTVLRDLLGEARSLLVAGDISGARHRVDLWRSPKWCDRAECEAAYAAVMGRP